MDAAWLQLGRNAEGATNSHRVMFTRPGVLTPGFLPPPLLVSDVRAIGRAREPTHLDAHLSLKATSVSNVSRYLVGKLGGVLHAGNFGYSAHGGLKPHMAAVPGSAMSGHRVALFDWRCGGIIRTVSVGATAACALLVRDSDNRGVPGQRARLRSAGRRAERTVGDPKRPKPSARWV